MLGMGAANERRRYNITSSLISWAHTWNDPSVPCLQSSLYLKTLREESCKIYEPSCLSSSGLEGWLKPMLVNRQIVNWEQARKIGRNTRALPTKSLIGIDSGSRLLSQNCHLTQTATLIHILVFECRRKSLHGCHALCDIVTWHSRADSRLVPSQWETPLQCNTASHWLGANLESALHSTPHNCRSSPSDRLAHDTLSKIKEWRWKDQASYAVHWLLICQCII